MPSAEEDWLDAESGPLVRPYAAVGGRTRASRQLDMMTMVAAIGEPPAGAGTDLARAFAACARPVSVAEVAARLQLPAAVAKILLSDLIDSGSVAAREPGPALSSAPDRDILQKVLHGLQSL